MALTALLVNDAVSGSTANVWESPNPRPRKTTSISCAKTVYERKKMRRDLRFRSNFEWGRRHRCRQAQHLLLLKPPTNPRLSPPSSLIEILSGLQVRGQSQTATPFHTRPLSAHNRAPLMDHNLSRMSSLNINIHNCLLGRLSMHILPPLNIAPRHQALSSWQIPHRKDMVVVLIPPATHINHSPPFQVT